MAEAFYPPYRHFAKKPKFARAKRLRQIPRMLRLAAAAY
jgi:hypothetical protein